MPFENKYRLDVVSHFSNDHPEGLAKSRDEKLVFQCNIDGDFHVLANNQETIIRIPKEDARDFAFWILQAWRAE